MKSLLLATLLVLAGCAAPTCSTAIAIVGRHCPDGVRALCDLNFANPVPANGCWLPVDPHGPSQGAVLCVQSCN